MELQEKNRLLRIRKNKKKKNPSFVRYESWRYTKLKKSGWRKQRGIDNKTRRKMKMGVKSPEPGYRSPKNIRGLHPSGLEDVLVINIKDFENLSPEKHGIRISARLGARKRIKIIEHAQDLGFKIFNIGYSKEDLLEMEESIEEEDDEEEEKDSKKKSKGK
ncbi:MAG: 50S ribosomal protein L32e [Promethearchaeota archaeon]